MPVACPALGKATRSGASSCGRQNDRLDPDPRQRPNDGMPAATATADVKPVGAERIAAHVRRSRSRPDEIARLVLPPGLRPLQWTAMKAENPVGRMVTTRRARR